MAMNRKNNTQSSSVSSHIFLSWTFQVPLKTAVAVLALQYKKFSPGFQLAVAHLRAEHNSPMWSPTTSLGSLCD